MIAHQLTAAIEAAYFGEFDSLAQDIWAAHGAGHLTDDEASALAEQLQARRRSNRPLPSVGHALRPKLTFKRAPKQRSPDRARSIARRRQLAASGPLPPALAANFTTGELAVLKIIADEVGIKGYCDLDLPQIAARAGVCVTTARNAIRFAELDCLLTVLRRPRPGLKHLTNVIRIIRAEWKVWLRKHPLKIGVKKTESTVIDFNFRDRNGVIRRVTQTRKQHARKNYRPTENY